MIQTVREKFTYRDCERIHQPLAPFHVTPHGWARPNLLAMIMFEKFGQHQPLNRQTERCALVGNRRGEHQQAHRANYTGIRQVDAFSSYDKLYTADRSPGVILEVRCWAHARQKFFVLADVEAAARRRTHGKQPAAISMDVAPISISTCARNSARPWWPIGTSGCASNAASCRAPRMWPKRWSKCSSAGRSVSLR